MAHGGFADGAHRKPLRGQRYTLMITHGPDPSESQPETVSAVTQSALPPGHTALGGTSEARQTPARGRGAGDSCSRAPPPAPIDPAPALRGNRGLPRCLPVRRGVPVPDCVGTARSPPPRRPPPVS